MAKTDIIKAGGYPITVEQRDNIWKLKQYGASHQRIAQEVQCDPHVVPIVLKEMTAETIEQLGGMDTIRAIENSKLDTLQNIWFTLLSKKQQLMKDNIVVSDKELERISNNLLKIAERRARLLGTDAPIKHQVNLRVFDQFTTMLIEAIQEHVPPEAQKAINDQIQAALLLAERYRSESEEENG